MIPFNVPVTVGGELAYLQNVFIKRKFCGDGEYTKKCHSWFAQRLDCKKVFLTTSCTHALEMAALLANIGEGDEVILPSYTFPSTGNAFALRGAKLVFVDIRPDTMNIDENLVGAALTERTKAIVLVHYAGIACAMDEILSIARARGVMVIEDAAQALMSTYKGRYLGTFGQFGCLSFHETKNVQCGEGGALIVNDWRFVERAEYIREKGTNRSKFWRGEIDKYTWVDLGSSYLPSELNASFLYAQLEMAEMITRKRVELWEMYYERLKNLEDEGKIQLPAVTEGCTHNGHMFYVKTHDLSVRTSLIDYLKKEGISTVFHYVPLHSAPSGGKYGRFLGEDRWTTRESERLVRLPMYYDLTYQDVIRVANKIHDFFKGS
jgi:dTDP-4-amino-4,6-dideoxygalactose transaminase